MDERERERGREETHHATVLDVPMLNRKLWYPIVDLLLRVCFAKHMKMNVIGYHAATTSCTVV